MYRARAAGCSMPRKTPPLPSSRPTGCQTDCSREAPRAGMVRCWSTVPAPPPARRPGSGGNPPPPPALAPAPARSGPLPAPRPGLHRWPGSQCDSAPGRGTPPTTPRAARYPQGWLFSTPAGSCSCIRQASRPGAVPCSPGRQPGCRCPWLRLLAAAALQSTHSGYAVSRVSNFVCE